MLRIPSTLVIAALAAGELLAQAQEPKRYELSALLDGSGFVRIPPGEFIMGSIGGHLDEQQHRVRITKPFEMGIFEVTQSQWEAVVRSAHPSPEKAAPDSDNPSHFKGPTLPVESVSWNDVQRFLRALNTRDGKYDYRLPTEAEWEYACRAGSTGDYSGSLAEMAWYEANSGGETRPAGQKMPNAWGLYDMHGNVAEWVQDWYGFDYYDASPATDPVGPGSGSYRGFRGGGWLATAEASRSAARAFNFPGDGYYNVGFRLVRTPRRN